MFTHEILTISLCAAILTNDGCARVNIVCDMLWNFEGKPIQKFLSLPNDNFSFNS